jgi:hypothetical protein
MGRVIASTRIPVLTSEVEALWYDLSRWPAFIDGFGRIEKAAGEWPHPGAELTWVSAPGGRGRVLEDVVRHEPRAGQEVRVEDERMRGTQRVGFAPDADGVLMTIELVYELKGSRPLNGLFDALFVRRPMRDSLNRTLARFRREAITDHELAAAG